MGQLFLYALQLFWVLDSDLFNPPAPLPWPPTHLLLPSSGTLPTALRSSLRWRRGQKDALKIAHSFIFFYFFLFVWWAQLFCCVWSKDGGTNWTHLKVESRPVIPKATTGLSWSQFASWSKCTCKLSRPHEVNLHAWLWEAWSKGKSWDWLRVEFYCDFFSSIQLLSFSSSAKVKPFCCLNSSKKSWKSFKHEYIFFIF